MLRIFYIIFFLLIISNQIYAETLFSSSIEWITCESDVIVLGKIENIEFAKPNRLITYDLITIKIDKVLKGNVANRKLLFELKSSDTKTISENLNKSNNSFIIFLKKNTANDKKHTPSSLQSPLSILNLDHLPADIYNKDGKFIRSADEIINLTKEWANIKIAHSLTIETNIIRSFGFFIVAPAEEKYRKIFLDMAQSENQFERKRAAFELSKFPGDETEKVLFNLLNDDTEQISYFAADVIYKIEYSVRAAAYNSLKVLGQSISDVKLERQPTFEEQHSLRQNYWKKSFTDALPVEWKVFSVEDGKSLQIQGHDTTSVLITLEKDNYFAKIVLIPKEWDKIYFPQTEDLGINGKNSQGGRHFFLEGNLPKDVQDKLIGYFGLEK